MSIYSRIRAAGRRAGAMTVIGAAVAAGSAGVAVAATSSNSAATDNSVAAATATLKKFTGPVTSYPAVSAVHGTSSLKGKTVWFVPFDEAIPDIAVIGSGLKTALSHLGIHTHICDGQLLPTTISECLNEAVRAKASAVVTLSVDYREVPVAMNNVTSHKIPLLAAGASNDAGAGASKLLHFLTTVPLNEKLGGLAVDAAIADSKGTAHILWVGATDSLPLIKTTTAAAQETKTACPNCTFNTVLYSTAEQAKLASQVSAALIQNPDTNYIVTGTDPALPDIIQGVNSAGYGTKVTITASGGALSALQAIKTPTTPKTVQDIGFSNLYSGWSYADGVIRMMLGKPPVLYVGGFRVFDQQNVGGLNLTPSAFATNSWYGPTSYQTAFLKAWTGK